MENTQMNYRFQKYSLYRNVQVKKFSIDAKSNYLNKNILFEHVLEIFINGKYSMRIMCTESELEELVLGRLLTCGVISSLEDVKKLCISDCGNKADVCLTEESEVKEYAEEQEVCSVTPFSWRLTDIDCFNEKMKQDSPIHAQTRGTHSAMLMYRGEIYHISEDIGRHNAVDKVLGKALKGQVPLTKCILYTTGRVPVDMIEKVIRAKVPVLVSKEAPTMEGIHAAQNYNLTLLQVEMDGGCVIYAGTDPVTYRLDKEA